MLGIYGRPRQWRGLAEWDSWRWRVLVRWICIPCCGNLVPSASLDSGRVVMGMFLGAASSSAGHEARPRPDYSTEPPRPWPRSSSVLPRPFGPERSPRERLSLFPQMRRAPSNPHSLRRSPERGARWSPLSRGRPSFPHRQSWGWSRGSGVQGLTPTVAHPRGAAGCQFSG